MNCLLTLALFGIVRADVWRVPLQKPKLNLTFEEAKRQLAGQRMRLQAKYGQQIDVRVEDVGNTAYTSEVQVGTPGQKEIVIFDTGSANLWVPNDGIPAAYRKNRYDHSRSSSWQGPGGPFYIQYGSGPVSGEFSTDALTLGSLTVDKFVFAEVSDVDGIADIYGGDGFDGICGLGFRAISVGGKETLMKALARTGKLDHSVFSFYLGDLKNGAPADGDLVFGGVNTSHYNGKIQWVSLIGEDYWRVALQDIKVNGASIPHSTMAIIDSGTSLLAGPPSDVRALASALGALWNGATMVARCNSLKGDIAFRMGNVDWSLSSEDLVFVKQGPMCLLGVQALPASQGEQPKWIVGDVFMRKYYSVFDVGNSRVGFAPAVVSGGSGEVPDLKVQWNMWVILAIICCAAGVIAFCIICWLRGKRTPGNRRQVNPAGHTVALPQVGQGRRLGGSTPAQQQTAREARLQRMDDRQVPMLNS